MDLATVLDFIVIKSGYHPDHINHPSFGMYLLLCLADLPARVMGMLSAVNMADLAHSLNPLACVAELTDYIRLLSVFLCVGTAFFLGAALVLYFEPPFLLALAVWAALLSQASFLYHSTMNRSELYAVFYWALAIFALAASRRSKSERAGRLATLLAGLCLGLAFLTKLQAAIYVVFAPAVFVFLSESEQGAAAKRETPQPSQGKGYFILSLVNLAFFSLTLALSYFAEAPEGVWTFTDKYSLTSFGYLFLALYLACPMGLLLTRRTYPHLRLLLVRLVILCAGFACSGLLSFLMFSDVTLAWRYFLIILKMSYFRAELYGARPLAEYAQEITTLFRYSPATPLLHLFALGALLVRGRGLSRRFKLLLPLASLAALACGLLSSRPILRDFIWWETVINVMTLIYVLLLWRNAPKAGRVIAAILLLALCFGNVRNDFQVLDRLDARYYEYGWNPRPWLRFVFFGAQQRYKEFIQERYGYTDETAQQANGPELRQAMHHAEARRLAEFVFPGKEIDLRQVGVAAPGFPVSPDDLSLRVTEVDARFHEATLVSPWDARDAGGFLPAPAKDEVTVEWPLSPYRGDAGALAVLPRADIQVWMFESAEEGGGGPELTLSDGARRIRMTGKRLEKFTWITPPAAGVRPVFLILSSYFQG